MFTVCTDGEADGPWEIFQRVKGTHTELEELAGMFEAGTTVAFMMRHGEKLRQGRMILGTCYSQPSAQGDLRPLFEQLLEDTLGYYPDFLIILDGIWWADATALQREVLVVHELLHAGQACDKHGTPLFDRDTGRPKPTIRPHDIEEFHAVAARYGAWSPDVQDFAAALERFAAKPGPAPTREGPVF